MKKLKELPLTSLSLKYAEKISDNEVNHYCISPTTYMVPNQGLKEVLEKFLGEEVEIENKSYPTALETVICSEVLDKENKKIPTKKFDKAFEVAPKGSFWNKAKVFANRYLKTNFKIKYNYFKSTGIGLSFYKGDEEKAIKVLNEEIKKISKFYNIVGFFMFPSVVELSDPVLGEEKHCLFCYPTVSLDFEEQIDWVLDFHIEDGHLIQEISPRNIKINEIVVTDGCGTFDTWRDSFAKKQ